MRTFESRADKPWLLRLYWPVFDFEPPLLSDGSVDVRAICRAWDDAVNQGTTPRERES
jgi:hypothetical protein